MPLPTAPPTCPSCAIPLGLFTPRESIAHVNACLDAQQPSSPPLNPPLTCAICSRDLSKLTPHARNEHVNRCADSTLPLPPSTRPTIRRPPSRVPPPAPDPPPADPCVRRLLNMLGLERYISRFATEEIDFAALRLLNPSDFLQLRIPEAARRRIAEAMQSAHILAHVEEPSTGQQSVPCSSAQQDAQQGDAVLTQRFAKSKLGSHAGLEDDSDSDGEFDVSMGHRAAACAKEAGVLNDDSVLGVSDSDAATGSAKPAETLDMGGESDSDCIALGVIVGGSSPVKNNPGSPQSPEREEDDGVGKYVRVRSRQKDQDESDLSSLSDLEREAWKTSQITLESKLNRWRRKQLLKERSKHMKEVSNERRRHKRELERIQQRYDGMCKRLCGLPIEPSEKRPISRVTKEADSMSSYRPSSQSSADNGTVENALQVEATVPKPPLGEDGSSHSSLLLSPAPLARSLATSPEGREDVTVVRDAELRDPASVSLDRFVTIDLTHDASGDDERKSRTPVGNRKLFPNPEITETIVLSSTKPTEKEPSISGSNANGNLDERLWNILRAACSDTSSQQSDAEIQRATRTKQKSLFSSSDEEEVMDLTCTDAGKAVADSSTKQNTTAVIPNEQSARGEKLNSAIAKASTEVVADLSPAPTQSRLKRRQKVTPGDVISAIRQDKALYDDMLMMDSVPFARILESITSSGVKVAKKNLTSLLQKEGVSFKPDEPTEKKKAAAVLYFSRLNEHSD